MKIINSHEILLWLFRQPKPADKHMMMPEAPVRKPNSVIRMKCPLCDSVREVPVHFELGTMAFNDPKEEGLCLSCKENPGRSIEMEMIGMADSSDDGDAAYDRSIGN